MTISNDDQSPLPAAIPLQEEPTLKHKKPRCYSSMIALIALCCALYGFYSNLQLRRSAAKQVATLHTQIEALSQQQGETAAAIDSVLKPLQEKLFRLDKNFHTFLRQQTYQAKDWLLLKARYYLEMAQLNAQWSDNTLATSVLLKQTDDLLAQLHDQRLFNIRKTIAQELIHIKSIPNIDKAGLLNQLEATQVMITNLPLKTAAPLAKVSLPTPNTRHTDLSTWHDHLQASLNLLQKLIVIRRHNEAIYPLPSVEQEILLRDSIRFNLRQAQWAILQNNEAVYKLSLTNALKKINDAFALNDLNTQGVLTQLKELQQIHFIQSKPDFSPALLLLNQLIDMPNPAQLPAIIKEENNND